MASTCAKHLRGRLNSVVAAQILRPNEHAGTCPPALVKSQPPLPFWNAADRADSLLAWRVVAVLLLLVALTAPAHAQVVADTPACVEPVRNAAGEPDPEIDRALRAAVPLLLPPARSWRFATAPEDCGASARVRFTGHRVPEVRYLVEVQLPDQATQSLSVESHAAMGTFAVAEALCVNALLLLGQPLGAPVPTEHDFHLWLAPTATLGLQIATFGSELGVLWSVGPNAWFAASGGFEAFGSGSAPLGKYQSSAVQAAVLGGWRWHLRSVTLAAGLGLRERTWLSHLQTAALHEHYDVDLALAGELRALMRVSRPLRIGLVVRPSLGLEDVVVAAPGEAELFRVPRFLVQLALQFAIDL